jgi:hypothetical protein
VILLAFQSDENVSNFSPEIPFGHLVERKKERKKDDDARAGKLRRGRSRDWRDADS